MAKRGREIPHVSMHIFNTVLVTKHLLVESLPHQRAMLFPPPLKAEGGGKGKEEEKEGETARMSTRMEGGKETTAKRKKVLRDTFQPPPPRYNLLFHEARSSLRQSLPPKK